MWSLNQSYRQRRPLHDTRHDDNEPNTAFGADKVTDLDWIMLGREDPLRVSLGASDLRE